MKQGAEVVPDGFAHLSTEALTERLERIDAARHELADAATELMFPNWEGIGEVCARYDREESAIRAELAQRTGDRK